jgi:polysaccharide pyruvyl transferase WcaK-like protein
MPRRIGLVGYFGWGNYGDELFLRLWESELAHVGEPEVVHQINKSPYFVDPPRSVAAQYDAFVVGGGDLVVPWNLSKLYWRDEWLARPVYIAGVGVPTWGTPNERVIRRLRRFFQHPNVRFICARDPESAAWIAEHLEPNVDVQWAPDLVFALDLPVARPPAGKPILSVVTRKRRRGSDDYRHVVRLCDRAREEGYRIRQIVLATGSTGKADLEVAHELEVPDKELVYSEKLDDITRAIGESKALASMKFHGTVVATAYGIPSIVMAPTDKSRNLYRMIGQERLLSHVQHKDLADKLGEVETPIPAEVGADLKDRSRAMINQLVSALDQLPRRPAGRQFPRLSAWTSRQPRIGRVVKRAGRWLQADQI